MARNITVTFADGTTHTYQGAPDNVTPDQVEARAVKEFSKAVKGIDGGAGAAPAPEPAPSPSFFSQVGQGVGNLAAGAVRGAGSIGATLLAPVDMAKDALNGKGLSLASNRERRAAMDGGLQELGAEPESWMYKGGKLAGEIAGTAGASGLVARSAAAIPAIASRAPNLIQAIGSSGLSAGSATGAAGLLTRAGGGAAAGAVQAGLVDPHDVGIGAAIGGAMPAVGVVAGAAGNKLSKLFSGPAQSADLVQGIEAARNAGYVIPPTQASATLGNRLLEGFSGKLTTAQNASAKNQGVTNDLAAKAIGLPAGEKITPDALKAVRNTAGQAYAAIGGTGHITPGAAYTAALDSIAAPFNIAAQAFPDAKASPVLDLVKSLRSTSFDAAAAVEKIKQLRTAADDAFLTGNTDIARASKSAAGALEDAIEGHLQGISQPQLLKEFRDARQVIAKTYSVEKAMNPVTGSIDAKQLAAQLKRGKPLSDDLLTAAQFAGRFPKAAQAVEGMGSLPQTSPLDWAVGSGISAATANPLALASVMLRPTARAAALSPLVQNRLVKSGAPNALQRALSNTDLAQLGYRVAPVAISKMRD